MATSISYFVTVFLLAAANQLYLILLLLLIISRGNFAMFICYAVPERQVTCGVINPKLECVIIAVHVGTVKT